MTINATLFCLFYTEHFLNASIKLYPCTVQAMKAIMPNTTHNTMIITSAVTITYAVNRSDAVKSLQCSHAPDRISSTIIM